ncbi:pirin family protein [Gilvimarinus agarilyticus]|uniref:pirin family protein n=1 Tax=Gilvimarinus sp. 2_MG-2023 TaxID=3062666 RepID=UPI001C0923DC|nr:pirin family protein [Gilvimarinus sp. 2_MG-2023]MBU2887288.1 pirin family protein [Gilvimarinus agarilyticus]MDO6571947.1 pirin family protein [Gilvimarinus sp. 2_MG-2023]
MSNLASELVQDCSVISGCSALKLVLKPKDKDLGGFCVRRTLPTTECRSVGPWVFFDHMGPAHFKKDQGIDVRPHPHIGLATVTYLFTGEMLHRDSLGTEARVLPGDINLMVAGRGIVHSERQRAEIKAGPHDIHGLQLWLALPTELEQSEPGFFHYDQIDIPTVQQNGVPVRVMMGSAYGVTSPVKTLSETLYIEARLKTGQSLELPAADEKALYVVEGELTLKDTTLEEHSMAIFDAEAGITVTANRDTTLVVVGGASVGKRYMEWNFVASNKALIEQAKLDWQAGSFPKVPGDEEQFIPLPE